MSTQSRVSIIVVTFRKKDYLALCLNSIKKQSYPELEVIVVDAAQEKLSYCQALNQGIACSKGDFILCLNDDVVLDRDYLREALRGFFYDSQVGMVSGKILRGDGKIIDSTGLYLSPWRSAKERGYGRPDKNQFAKEEYIFGVNGAVAFYRRRMLEEIKEEEEYFDNDFSFFYEDLDIAWRAQYQGWKGYYIPRAIAWHLRGGTLRIEHGVGKPYARRYLNDRLQFDLIKNRYLAIIKNESLLGLWLYLPCILLYDLFIFSFILFFRPKAIKLLLVNLKIFKKALQKRKNKKCRFLVDKKCLTKQSCCDKKEANSYS